MRYVLRWSSYSALKAPSSNDMQNRTLRAEKSLEDLAVATNGVQRDEGKSVGRKTENFLFMLEMQSCVNRRDSSEITNMAPPW